MKDQIYCSLITCTLCGRKTGFEQAVDDGWLPYFYEGEAGHGPVCPKCFEMFLHAGNDEELEVRSEYVGKLSYHE